MARAARAAMAAVAMAVVVGDGAVIKAYGFVFMFENLEWEMLIFQVAARYVSSAGFFSPTSLASGQPIFNHIERRERG